MRWLAVLPDRRRRSAATGTGREWAVVIGQVTRGTTGVNRLRRIDRWIATLPVLRQSADPLVVDLGYGESATTSLELHERLSLVRPDVEVIGIEIEPERVRRAGLAARPGVSFHRGGFEIPLPAGRRPAVIRAMNVLRQYGEQEVAPAWDLMLARLQPGGVLIEGTCSELGRVASWVDLDGDGPRSLTISLRLRDLERPSVVAERLPKALIHRNVPGERVYDWLAALDTAWQRNAALSSFSPAQRWIATVSALRAEGWPVRGSSRRWRLGELAVDWDAVAPRT